MTKEQRDTVNFLRRWFRFSFFERMEGVYEGCYAAAPCEDDRREGKFIIILPDGKQAEY